MKKIKARIEFEMELSDTVNKAFENGELTIEEVEEHFPETLKNLFLSEFSAKEFKMDTMKADIEVKVWDL